MILLWWWCWFLLSNSWMVLWQDACYPWKVRAVSICFSLCCGWAVLAYEWLSCWLFVFCAYYPPQIGLLRTSLDDRSLTPLLVCLKWLTQRNWELWLSVTLVFFQWVNKFLWVKSAGAFKPPPTPHYSLRARRKPKARLYRPKGSRKTATMRPDKVNLILFHFFIFIYTFVNKENFL